MLGAASVPAHANSTGILCRLYPPHAFNSPLCPHPLDQRNQGENRLIASATTEEKMMSVSKAFALFMQEAPAHAQAWLQAAHALDATSTLDKKTEE